MSYSKSRLALSLLLLITMILGALPLAAQAEEEMPRRKIVVFRENSLDEKAQDEILSQAGARKIRNMRHRRSKTVYANRHTERQLAQKPEVLRLDDDIVIKTFETDNAESLRHRRWPWPSPYPQPNPTPEPTPEPQPTPTPQPGNENVPWGVSKIGANSAWNTTSGESVRVAVIDTGIDLRHPDLSANIKGGYNALSPGQQRFRQSFRFN
ncbi:MAG: hypothetical protein AAB360_01095 [Patescibacteria group bacterium]